MCGVKLINFHGVNVFYKFETCCYSYVRAQKHLWRGWLRETTSLLLLGTRYYQPYENGRGYTDMLQRQGVFLREKKISS